MFTFKATDVLKWLPEMNYCLVMQHLYYLGSFLAYLKRNVVNADAPHVMTLDSPMVCVAFWVSPMPQ